MLSGRASVARLVDLQGFKDVMVRVHAVVVVAEMRDSKVRVLEGSSAVKGHPVRHEATAHSVLGDAVLPLGTKGEAWRIVAWSVDQGLALESGLRVPITGSRDHLRDVLPVDVEPAEVLGANRIVTHS